MDIIDAGLKLNSSICFKKMFGNLYFVPTVKEAPTIAIFPIYRIQKAGRVDPGHFKFAASFFQSRYRIPNLWIHGISTDSCVHMRLLGKVGQHAVKLCGATSHIEARACGGSRQGASIIVKFDFFEDNAPLILGTRMQ